MKNLLSSEALRLYKNKLFYALLSLAFLFGIGMQLYVYFGSRRSDTTPSIDMSFFAIAIVIGFVVAIFVSMFVGTEYSNATLRNKIMNGKSRIAVYLSKFIICCLAIFLIYVSYYCSSLIFGFIFNKSFTSSFSSIIAAALTLYLTTCSYIAIFLVIAMNWSKKSAVAVVSLVLTIVMFFGAVATSSILSEPEFYPECVYMDENGELRTEPEMPNPNYPKGKKRQVYEFLYDANTTGQCIQLSGAIDEIGYIFKPNFYLYSAGVIIVSTSIGIILFKKKDIV